MLRHLGECPECAQLAYGQSERDIDALQAMLVRERDESSHPGHAELVAYADGSSGAPEREIIESHLEDCATCRTDVGDLLALRRIRPRMPRWRIAVMAAAAAILLFVITMPLWRQSRSPVAPASTRPAITVTQPADRPAQPQTPALTTSIRPPAAPRYARAEWEKLVKTAVATGKLPFPTDLATLTAPDVLRGPGDREVAKLSPAGVVTDDTRPRFTWPATEGAEYVVMVYAGDEEIAKSDVLSVARWRPSKPLQRGRTYVWQVEVTAGGVSDILPAPPAPQAVFRVVSSRDHAQLEAAKATHPNDHVLHAVLAARAGLRDEALAALRRAEDSDETEKLRESYR